jgi:hypothetical protein
MAALKAPVDSQPMTSHKNVVKPDFYFVVEAAKKSPHKRNNSNIATFLCHKTHKRILRWQQLEKVSKFERPPRRRHLLQRPIWTVIT